MNDADQTDSDQASPGPDESVRPEGATTEPPPGDQSGRRESDFDASRLRSIADAKRSSTDRMIGGVSTGLARYLNLDPVLIRIAFVVLTFAGGAGVILYLATWFFLPSDKGPSYAAEWFNLDENEERVRVAGLVIAAAIAVVSVIGDTGWGWGGSNFGWIIPTAVLIGLIVLIPKLRSGGNPDDVPTEPSESATQPLAQPSAQPVAGAPVAPHDPANFQTAPVKVRREPRSKVLLALTVSITAIALAVTRLVGEAQGGIEWTTYVAVALTIVGLALLISSLWGEGAHLIWIGVLLAATLTLGSLMPSARVGQQWVNPDTAAGVESTYSHGIGQFELDLTGVTDPEALVGRTISIETGVGETKVILPEGLPVSIESSTSAGDLRVFDRRESGADVSLDVPDSTQPALTIDLEHRLGTIQVIRE